jgi:hypothetical protein
VSNPAPRLLILLLALLAAAANASCDAPEGTTQLTIEGLGRAYFKDFKVDAMRNFAELSGGVCLEDLAGEWTVNARHVAVTGLQPGKPLNLQVDDAHLVMEGWNITSAFLTSDGNTFVVHDADFTSDGLTGTLEQGIVRLDASGVEAIGLRATGPGYRVEGATAQFHDGILTLGDALITTCTCDKAPFYQLVGETATVHLVGEELHLTRGELQIGRLRIALAEEFEVSSRSLQEIKPPLLLEYTATDEAANVLGYGLSLIVPQLKLAEHVTAELGLLGLDAQHPLGLYGLLRYRHDGVNALVGYTRGGPRADFSVRRPLNGWLDATFAVNNRHEKAEDFLHEGLLELNTTFPALTLPAGQRLTFGAGFLAAVSSQRLSGSTVAAPRVRWRATGEYRLPETAYGQLTLKASAENTSYGGERQQFAMRVQPEWQLVSGPFTVNAAYDWRFTQGVSPFSSKLDRLAPVSRASASVRWQQQLNPRLNVSATAAGVYNLLPISSSNPVLLGFENLSLDLRATAQTTGEWTVRPRLFLQFAGLLDPRNVPERKAYVEGSVYTQRGELELGLLGRYQLPGGSAREGFEVLEASVGLPLQLGTVKAVPFIGIDVAPLLGGQGGVNISSHGLQLEFDTCCAILQAGYRLHDNVMTTSFSASFER